jgi:predicted Rdx family selenoprotein
VRAVRAAAVLREELPGEVDVELKKGSGGIFTVAVDGMVVAAKHVGGFPTDDEIVHAVAEVLPK